MVSTVIKKRSLEPFPPADEEEEASEGCSFPEERNVLNYCNLKLNLHIASTDN